MTQFFSDNSLSRKNPHLHKPEFVGFTLLFCLIFRVTDQVQEVNLRADPADACYTP